jgi:hypothetical protein
LFQNRTGECEDGYDWSKTGQANVRINRTCECKDEHDWSKTGDANAMIDMIGPKQGQANVKMDMIYDMLTMDHRRRSRCKLRIDLVK